MLCLMIVTKRELLNQVTNVAHHWSIHFMSSVTATSLLSATGHAYLNVSLDVSSLFVIVFKRQVSFVSDL